MKIAFIGYGNMARTLSGRWASQHQVFIGDRDAGRAAKLAFNGRKLTALHCGEAADIVIKFLFSGRDMCTVLNLIQPEVKEI